MEIILTRGLPALLLAFLRVVLGADELPAVAQALAAVGKVERRGVAAIKHIAIESKFPNHFSVLKAKGQHVQFLLPVEGRVCVAGLLLDLLQPGALELWAGVAAAEPRAGVGRVRVIQLNISVKYRAI